MMSSIVKGQSARVVGKSDGVRREGFGAGEPLMGALGAPKQPGCKARGRSELRARPARATDRSQARDRKDAHMT
jgi:hypothetical protein